MNLERGGQCSTVKPYVILSTDFDQRRVKSDLDQQSCLGDWKYSTWWCLHDWLLAAGFALLQLSLCIKCWVSIRRSCDEQKPRLAVLPTKLRKFLWDSQRDCRCLKYDKCRGTTMRCWLSGKKSIHPKVLSLGNYLRGSLIGSSANSLPGTTLFSFFSVTTCSCSDTEIKKLQCFNSQGSTRNATYSNKKKGKLNLSRSA
jgi:hypothetical protein